MLNPIITQSEIDNATFEAIYWWNRDEHYYHKYFSQLSSIYNDKELLSFFTTKIFEVFLREYAIRRNLSSGYNSVDIFINELFEYNFVSNVLDGNTNIIDDVSDLIKANGNSTNRQTKSLLSKVAFLINPHNFLLFDSLAKESLWKLKNDKRKFKYKEIENYTGFLKQTILLHNEIESVGLFKNTDSILSLFKSTFAFDFFGNNNEAFQMRIIDKALWLLGQDPEGRKYKQSEYIKLNSL